MNTSPILLTELAERGRFTPANCPHCEYDRRFPGFEGGGWMQQDNNGPIVSCPMCNPDGSHPRGPVEIIHQRRTKVGGVAVSFTVGRISPRKSPHGR